MTNTFWSKVKKSGDCWIWTAAKIRRGYGAFRFNGRTIRAHRFAYLTMVGEIPKGLSVLHKCDNRACVNPKHLFLGTASDNSADMIAKGRSLKGERHSQAKLTEAEVRAILASKLSAPKLAEAYSVSVWSIYDIRNRRTWVHL